MKKDVYELTNPQRNILQLEQVNEKGNSINHILTIMKLKGNLDEELLSKTIYKIIEINDSFRIHFIKDDSNIYQYFENSSTNQNLKKMLFN